MDSPIAHRAAEHQSAAPDAILDWKTALNQLIIYHYDADIVILMLIRLESPASVQYVLRRLNYWSPNERYLYNSKAPHP